MTYRHDKHDRGTVDFSSEPAMPLDSTAECAEPRRGLTRSRNSAPPAFSAVINHLIFRQCHDRHNRYD